MTSNTWQRDAASGEDHSTAEQRAAEGDNNDTAGEALSEHTPLLTWRGSNGESTTPSKPTRRRWPSVVALLLLLLAVILVIVVAFVGPDVAKEYAEKAIVFEPDSLSIDSFTLTGVRAHIQGSFCLDASRVEKPWVRNLGRFFTFVVAEVESDASAIEVSLPEYGNVVLGTAHVPPIKVDVRNKRWNFIDFLSDLEPGEVNGIRSIANDWIDGRLGHLRVLAKANVPLKSGLFSLGSQFISHELTFANGDIPTMPTYDIKRLDFREVEVPTGKAMAADARISIQNDYPVDITIPPLAFAILVSGCDASDPPIMIADGLTQTIHVTPKERVLIDVVGTVRRLPDVLVQDCPNTNHSPLDIILGQYIHGNETTVYIRGSPDAPSADTPHWIGDLISSFVVPVPVPGHDSLAHLLRNFSLTDTHFGLPDPWAEPNTPMSKPRISATVKAFVGLPEEMNFNLSISRVRATADVYYEEKKFGELDLHKWQSANSSRVEFRKHPSKDDIHDEEGPMLLIESVIREAPLTITDEDGFTSVVERLIFGKEVVMQVKAEIDVEVDTALGLFIVRGLPATGKVPVKPFPSAPEPPYDSNPSHDPDHDHGPDHTAPSINSTLLHPKLTDIRLLSSSPNSLLLSAGFNVTNPVPYSATIPYLDLQLVKNGCLLGHATVRNLDVTTGRNSGLSVVGAYEPAKEVAHVGHEHRFKAKGESRAREAGRELLSDFVSGKRDITIGVRGHLASFIPPELTRDEEGSLFSAQGRIQSPAIKILGRIFERLGTFDVQLPRIDTPFPRPGHGGDDDDLDPPLFIKDATFHLLSSSATFLLLNPLPHDEIWVTWLNATALYPHSAPEPPGDGSDPDEPDEDPWHRLPGLQAHGMLGSSDNRTVLEPVGHIVYFNNPFSVPPVIETPDHAGAQTPKLPVDWKLGSVGYDAVRKALGGGLKLGARAQVGIKLGEFEEVVNFERPGGIGARIRL